MIRKVLSWTAAVVLVPVAHDPGPSLRRAE